MSSRARPRCRGRLASWLIPLLLAVGSPADAGFTVTDLGVVVPGQSSGATGINSAGATSGTAANFRSTAAVQAVGGGTFRNISMGSLPGATSSSGAAINDAGQVAGSFASAIDGRTHAFIAVNGSAIDLGTFGDGRFKGADSRGVAINATGTVLAAATLADRSQVVFRTTAAGGVSEIALPGRSMQGTAGGINADGVVVGSFLNGFGASRVFVAAGATATEVATVGAPGFGLNSYGTAINDKGAIAGYGDFGAGSHAFYMPSPGRFVDIGVTGSFTSSMALGMNNQGRVVGTMNSSGMGAHAFLWDEVGGMVDLNSLLSGADRGSWVLTTATGINGSNQVAGQGYFNGQLHGFVLTPDGGSGPSVPAATVPAPPSAWLAGAGLILVGGWARFRRGRTRRPDTAGPAGASPAC